MLKTRQVKLSIPNNLIFAELAADNARMISKMLGFQERAAREIEMAAEEVATDIIKNSFDRGQEDNLEAVFNLKDSGLEIIFREKGMPRDPDLAPDFSLEMLRKTWSEKGLGMYLVKRVMDGLFFHNLGKSGRETCMFKYLDQDRVDSVLSREELKKAGEESTADSLPRGSVEYSVRRLKPEEAVEVSRCIYTAYGYTYLHEDMYYPDRVRTLNKSGELISFVAATNNEIIAHAALIIEDDPLVPEFGVAATKPKFRGQGCLNALSTVRVDEAVKRGFTGGYGMGVTSHFYSQKSMLKHGLQPCALLLSNAQEPQYKDMKQRNIQRESAVMQFKYLRETDKIVMYPPQQHADFIDLIYANIG
ncbi:MAG: ATP-binding protein, partial [Desulfonatronovibrio sp.]